jgi:hypothetical protein
MFSEGKTAEEEGGVEGVTGEGVAEERQASDVTRGEAGGRVRISAEKLPGGKVGDEEKLERAEENGPADAKNAAVIGEPGSDEHTEQEARVDDRDEAVETDEEIGGKEGPERKEKGRTAITATRMDRRTKT